MGIATAERAARVGEVGWGWWSAPGRTRSATVIADSFDRGLRARIGDGQTELSLVDLCEVCAEVTELLVSIVLSGPGAMIAADGASDGAEAIEELQLTLGEGPRVDTWRGGRPVLVDDLRHSGSRWVNFVPAAEALGVRAAYSYPLRVGAIRMGVLSLYSPSVSPLTPDRADGFATLAELVTGAVLSMQSATPEGALAPPLLQASEQPAVVHQAVGMVSVQLDCSVQDAFARLQARAFADDVGVGELARRVVRREVRFEP